jgi:purine-cytosine permease-like protein
VVTAGGNALAPSAFTGLLPTWLGKLVLLCICLGAIAANAINIYSASLSCMAMGIKLPTNLARASVSIVFGIAGFFVALSGLNDVSKYENFLLVIAYWIGPWLGVVFVDRWLRRGTSIDAVIAESSWRGSREQAGAIPMFIGIVLSIWLFANQTEYVGIVPKHVHQYGDLAFEAGFIISAVLYWLLVKLSLSRPARLDPAIVK